MATLAEAQELDSHGFNVIPAGKGKKAPLLESWKQYQTTRSSSRLSNWWGNRDHNTYIVCGSISRLLVLDIDNEGADIHWREVLGDHLLDTTTCVKTSKGHHYYFRLEAGDDVQSWSVHTDELDFDVRAEGGGVVGPYSTHESGHVYAWVRDASHLQPVPDALRSQHLAEKSGADTGEIGSSFTQLLHEPPTEGGRNIWLAKVAGHLAKWVPHDDAMIALTFALNDRLNDPLPRGEVNTTVHSILQAENRKPATGAVFDRDSGWLHGDGEFLWTEAMDTSRTVTVERCSNFDLRVLSIIDHEDGNRDYKVRLTCGDRIVETLLESRDMTSPKKLGEWLSRRGALAFPVAGDRYGKSSFMGRVMKYLMSQDAPIGQAIHTYGWSVDAGGFVAPEGIITAEGLRPHDAIVPHPKLAGWAKCQYGMSSEQDALDALEEVLTFHDEQATAVIGAWAMMCNLKPQVMEHSPLFPFLAIEAASGSGKSTGFMPMMMQLTGNQTGAGEFTMAALRDMASASHSCPVWIDDVASFDQAFELVRQSTADGQRGKKGQNNHEQEMVGLYSPIVLSGESLGPLAHEKALQDRSVQVHLPPVVDRRSLHVPGRGQWLDVVQLKQEWPDLSVHAGTLLRLCLSHADRVVPLVGLKGSNRVAQRNSIISAGGHLLDLLLGTVDKYAGLVDQWIATQSEDNQNILVSEILPTIWHAKGHPVAPSDWSPVHVVNGNLYANSKGVVEEWKHFADTERKKTLGDMTSIQAQFRAVDAVPSVKVTVSGGQHSSKVLRYWRLSEELTKEVIHKAGLVTLDQYTQGVLEDSEEAHPKTTDDLGSGQHGQ